MSNSASSDNMRHMNYIDGVAAEDCAVLRVKEATYMGSWKRAGGRSAWFMARRNMDRLIQMLAPPSPPNGESSWEVVENTTISVLNIACPLPCILSEESQHKVVRGIQYMRDLVLAEDVFAKIEENPSGEDGTVLACLRDLRRYLVLVEAEMRARGVVRVDPPARSMKAPYLEDVVQTAVSEPAWSLLYGLRRREYNAAVANRDTGSETLVSEPVVTDSAQASERRVPRFENEPNRPGTPENGGHHGKLTPWVCDGEFLMGSKLAGELVGKFWSQRARDVFTLEPHVQNYHIPSCLRGCYNMRGESWTLRMSLVPLEVRDYFPSLPLEQNMREWEEMPEWQRVLYTWLDGENKYRLAVENHSWHVEAA